MKKATGSTFQKALDELLAAEAGRQLMQEAADFIGRVYLCRDFGKPRLLRCPDLRDAVVPNDAIIGVYERLMDLADEYALQRKALEKSFAAGIPGGRRTRQPGAVPRPRREKVPPAKTLLKAVG